jgi:hypothetical protein
MQHRSTQNTTRYYNDVRFRLTNNFYATPPLLAQINSGATFENGIKPTLISGYTKAFWRKTTWQILR